MSFLVANEEYADQMLQDMVKHGAVDKNYSSKPINIKSLSDIWKRAHNK